MKTQFFSGVYDTWESIQREKFAFLEKNLGFWFLRGRVLDLGLGKGFFENFLEERGYNISNIVGLDCDRNVLKSQRVASVLGNGNRLPFKKESFDCVVCIDTVHLLEKDFLWILKPLGLVLLSVFFNEQNYEKKRELIENKMNGFDILKYLVMKEGRRKFLYLGEKD